MVKKNKNKDKDKLNAGYELSEFEKKIKKLEEEKLINLKQQRKDLNKTMLYGAFLLLNAGIIGSAIFFKNYIINFIIPFSTLHTIFAIIPIIGLLYANKKASEKFQKIFKRLKVPKEEKKLMEKEIKRLGIIKKLWLKWRIYDMKCKLDEYKESCNKAQGIVGKIKGGENKQLTKIKNEVIDNILMWKEDFVINKMNEKGETTNEPVDEEFLNNLSLNELYESYFLPGVLSLEKFVNGNSQIEVQKI